MENIQFSLQILILNDLLRANVIDKGIYDMAVKKIETIIKEGMAA